jgi:hypothetical protein
MGVFESAPIGSNETFNVKEISRLSGVWQSRAAAEAPLRRFAETGNPTILYSLPQRVVERIMDARFTPKCSPLGVRAGAKEGNRPMPVDA